MAGQPAAEILSGVSKRHLITKSVRSPLGFFVLALLIIEGLILGAGIFFGLPIEWKLTALGVAVLLFLIVFVTVVWLVVKYPRNLVFTDTSYVEFAALLYGEKAHPLTGPQLDALPRQDTPNPPVGQLPSPGDTNVSHDAT